jgi:hypothetical protein
MATRFWSSMLPTFSGLKRRESDMVAVGCCLIGWWVGEVAVKMKSSGCSLFVATSLFESRGTLYTPSLSCSVLLQVS